MRIKDEIRTYRLRLEHSLLSLQQRIDDGIAIPPSLLGTIHFARWFILDDEPNDHAHPGRLVFTSNFDGDLEHYIRDFSTVIPDDIDAIWSNCSGYPEAGCRRFTEFWNYLLGHQVQCRTFVVDRPDLTVDDINQAIPRP